MKFKTKESHLSLTRIGAVTFTRSAGSYEGLKY